MTTFGTSTKTPEGGYRAALAPGLPPEGVKIRPQRTGDEAPDHRVFAAT